MTNAVRGSLSAQRIQRLCDGIESLICSDEGIAADDLIIDYLDQLLLALRIWQSKISRVFVDDDAYEEPQLLDRLASLHAELQEADEVSM